MDVKWPQRALRRPQSIIGDLFIDFSAQKLRRWKHLSCLYGAKSWKLFKTVRKEQSFLLHKEPGGRWLNQDRQNKVNRWDSLTWLTAYWTRVRCLESRSRSDYTADREARAVLGSVELKPNGPERKSAFYLCWTQGGALQPARCWSHSCRLEAGGFPLFFLWAAMMWKAGWVFNWIFHWFSMDTGNVVYKGSWSAEQPEGVIWSASAAHAASASKAN